MADLDLGQGNLDTAGHIEGADPHTVDWIHIHETVKLLLLSMAQIELTLTDGDHNVTGLGLLFTEMAGHLREVNKHLRDSPDTPEEIMQHGNVLESKINEGVIAFQFYDRLSQRLEHVVTGLELAEDILSDEVRRIKPQSWKAIQKEIKMNYSLECEKKMFDLVIQGTPLSEALALYRDEHLEQEDDIELF
ncbi:hypothetical protein L2750_17635 [Shewanella submarina]|uniref:Uncharacterized protein n=1 Tax=Shewanella submarina TaxID=2016376 RepID=A0ABV7GF60_9GAMM|nr:hypothetical protein [Shewanella submarina]MCL1038955.1 hypothetical protein [Shewanella submarina]